MKFTDLLVMSLKNLSRRKLRTALTVLGVVIGTASIVVMVSLGIGLSELNRELISFLWKPDRDQRGESIQRRQLQRSAVSDR